VNASAGSIVAVALLALAAVSNASDSGVSAQEAVTFAKLKPLLERNCSMCHSAKPTMPFYAKAPDGVTFDSAPDLARYAARVLVMATKTDQMPPGNMTGMTEEERATLAIAIETQWPAAK
jgi:uncharacterized membrane protein